MQQTLSVRSSKEVSLSHIAYAPADCTQLRYFVLSCSY